MGTEGTQDRETFRNVRQQYIFDLQNPYAEEGVGSLEEHQARLVQSDRGVSKVFFGKECRRIFMQYVPITERTRALRPDFKAFIDKHENLPALGRQSILDELQRYDLSSMGALNPQLNRERVDALEKKLKVISSQARSENQ